MKTIFLESQDLAQGTTATGQSLLKEAYAKFPKLCDEYYEMAETVKDKKLAVIFKDEILKALDKCYALNKAYDRPHAVSEEMRLKASKILGDNVLDFEGQKRKADYKRFVGSDKLDAYASNKRKEKSEQNPMLALFDTF